MKISTWMHNGDEMTMRNQSWIIEQDEGSTSALYFLPHPFVYWQITGNEHSTHFDGQPDAERARGILSVHFCAVSLFLIICAGVKCNSCDAFSTALPSRFQVAKLATMPPPTFTNSPRTAYSAEGALPVISDPLIKDPIARTVMHREANPRPTHDLWE